MPLVTDKVVIYGRWDVNLSDVGQAVGLNLHLDLTLLVVPMPITVD
jgi:hypothetical protein